MDSSINDNDLVLASQQGDADATEVLLLRYRDFIKVVARSFYLVGAEYDDLIQIGMIALTKAISSYRLDGGSSFKTYASVCVRNAFKDAVERASAQKNSALNDYVSLSSASDDEPDLSGLIASDALDPESMFISKESEQAIASAFTAALGQKDAAIMQLYVSSVPYKVIAEELGVTQKHIDYTVSKVKKQIADILKKHN